MTRTAITVLLALAFTSCGSEEDYSGPCTLPQSVQTGEFTISPVIEESDCGPIGRFVGDVVDGFVHPNPDAGCELTDSSWDADMCDTQTTIDCDDGDWKMKITWSVITDKADQNHLYGTLTTDMTRFNGEYACSGTYTFDAYKLQ